MGTETEKNMPVTAAKLGEGDEQPRGTEHASGIEMSSTNSYDAARDSFKALRSPLTHPNGVPIFPDLSTEQQVSEASEATSQAESSIVADSDELDSTFDETDPSDAGYASDSATNASTSIESSVRDYMYENGRRYHRFREGQYNFPNDEMEQEREDMKHAMVKLLCNQKLNFAPIGEWPQQVLDIGTGTGAWAIESEQRHPSVQEDFVIADRRRSGRRISQRNGARGRSQSDPAGVGAAERQVRGGRRRKPVAVSGEPL